MSVRERKRGAWSSVELERLRALYPRLGAAGVARVLGRSPDGVRRRAAALFAGPSRRGRRWTRDEDGLLRLAAGVLPRTELGVLLRRPAAEVAARLDVLRARRPRHGPWTAAEEARLREFYGSRADADLVLLLRRSRRQIALAARRLCLSKDKRLAPPRTEGTPRSMRRWSAAELAELEVLYVEHDNLEIARRLQRSVVSVANKAHQLGLCKGPDRLAEMGRQNRNGRPQGGDGEG